MQPTEEKIFYETFANLKCLIQLGFKEKEFVREIGKDKFNTVTDKLIYFSKSRKVTILYFESRGDVSFWINNIDATFLKIPAWEQGRIEVSQWLEIHKHGDKDIFSFDKNITDLKENFEQVRKKFEEVCQIKEMEDILKGNDWWEEPLFTLYRGQ